VLKSATPTKQTALKLGTFKLLYYYSKRKKEKKRSSNPLQSKCNHSGNEKRKQFQKLQLDSFFPLSYKVVSLYSNIKLFGLVGVLRVCF
jgi:hypothetical protein